VNVRVGVVVAVAVGVKVGVDVGVSVGVFVAVGVGVRVAVGVLVGVGVKGMHCPVTPEQLALNTGTPPPGHMPPAGGPHNPCDWQQSFVPGVGVGDGVEVLVGVGVLVAVFVGVGVNVAHVAGSPKQVAP